MRGRGRPARAGSGLLQRDGGERSHEKKGGRERDRLGEEEEGGGASQTKEGSER